MKVLACLFLFLAPLLAGELTGMSNPHTEQRAQYPAPAIFSASLPNQNNQHPFSDASGEKENDENNRKENEDERETLRSGKKNEDFSHSTPVFCKHLACGFNFTSAFRHSGANRLKASQHPLNFDSTTSVFIRNRNIRI